MQWNLLHVYKVYFLSSNENMASSCLMCRLNFLSSDLIRIPTAIAVPKVYGRIYSNHPEGTAHNLLDPSKTLEDM